MDRKTKSILNNVTRELFEGERDISYAKPVEIVDSKPLTAERLYPTYQEMENERTNDLIGKLSQAAKNVVDDEKKAQNAYEASMLRSEIAAQNIRSRNPHTGPDPALSKLGDFERDYEIARHNPKTGYDPALGELNDADVPWYQQGWQWVQDNPGYAALAAGAPLALTGAYMLGKHRASKK